MSVDPYTDVAQWLDLDPRTEAIMRHPAGKGLMSAEQQAAMDDQACRVASTNWQGATAPTMRAHVANVAGIVVAIALVSCAPFLADVAGIIA